MQIAISGDEDRCSLIKQGSLGQHLFAVIGSVLGCHSVTGVFKTQEQSHLHQIVNGFKLLFTIMADVCLDEWWALGTGGCYFLLRPDHF